MHIGRRIRLVNGHCPKCAASDVGGSVSQYEWLGIADGESAPAFRLWTRWATGPMHPGFEIFSLFVTLHGLRFIELGCL